MKAKHRWNIDCMPDLSGKVIIVTGGNSGLGYESVKAFAGKGARVVLGSRSLDRGNAARSSILNDLPEAKIHVMSIDLADLDSVRNFGQEYRHAYDRLDVLLNNAGIMMAPYSLSNDGFEMHMATNHLGHFALTGLLMDLIKQTPGARIVTVSSNAHKYGEMDFDDLLYKDAENYSPAGAYARSKLANLLFAYELQRRLEDRGIDALSVAAHPGISTTNLARYVDDRPAFKLIMPMFRLFVQDAANGALPQIRASVDSEVKGGTYYGPGGAFQWTGSPGVVTSSGASHDKGLAETLWKISEELTGTRCLQ